MKSILPAKQTSPLPSLPWFFLCVEPLLACVSKAGLAIRFNVSSFDFAVEIENPSSNTLKHTDPQQSHATYCARILVFLAIIYQMNIWVRFWVWALWTFSALSGPPAKGLWDQQKFVYFPTSSTYENSKLKTLCDSLYPWPSNTRSQLQPESRERGDFWLAENHPRLGQQAECQHDAQNDVFPIEWKK